MLAWRRRPHFQREEDALLLVKLPLEGRVHLVLQLAMQDFRLSFEAMLDDIVGEVQSIANEGAFIIHVSVKLLLCAALEYLLAPVRAGRVFLMHDQGLQL